MGTNYYYYPKPPCECCGRKYESIHIGKSSAGWCFGLHVIPEEGINSLEDWKKLWQVEGSYIEDEYGWRIDPGEMLLAITVRGRKKESTWTESDYRRNYAEPGPNGLVRHTINNWCIGHGGGTWDLIVGEFS